MIPVEIYGKSLKENVSGSVTRIDYVKSLHTKQGTNAVLELNVEGTIIKAITHKLQIHPVKNYIIHADLMAVEDDTELTVTVPVSKYGRSLAEVAGGRSIQVVKDIKVRCKPADIPAGIEVDMAKFSIGDRISISQLGYPENVTPVFVQDTPVFVFNKGRGQSLEDEENEAVEAAAAEAATEGEATAPAEEEKAE
jgi:large subunit ribosomal protein L25